MNREKFTEKSVAALSGAAELAMERSNQAIEPQHLLLALLTADAGLIPELVTAAGGDVGRLKKRVLELCDALPRVSGGGSYISRDTEALLNIAERTAKDMKDEYVSVEHLMLGVFDTGGKIKDIKKKK